MVFYLKAFGLSLLYLLLFFTVFIFLQKPAVYHSSLGKISKNYEHKPEAGPYDIEKVSKPYTTFAEENFERWDAAIYKCVRDRMYITEEGYYGFVRGAFFPLFPGLWKISHLNSLGISIFNFFCFAIGIMLLIGEFGRASKANKLFLFCILISLPNSVIFIIPYTEALFVLTGAIAFTGILRNNYRMYFFGMLFLAMVRPATLFIFFSIVAAECLIFLKEKESKPFFRGLVQKLLPFVIGYFISVFIQFLYSGSWTTYLDAQKHWTGKIGLPETFSDWSIEGFGLSVFTICFVSIPVFLYLVYQLITGKMTTGLTNRFRFDATNAVNYTVMVSCFYLSGMLVFSLLTSDGSLHGFFRFVLCSPTFYLLAIFFFSKYVQNDPKPLYTVAILSFFLYIVFLTAAKYGGSRADFSFFGSYLFVINFLALAFWIKLNKSLKFLTTCLLFFLNLVWNTYMFNIFLSDGWIFT
jgi:hypothetical protein